MARIKHDFADTNVAKAFPAHGWTKNSQGVDILWLPLKRVLVFPDERLRGGRRSQVLRDGRSVNSGPFAETLHKLAVALRELHMLTRMSCDNPCGLGNREAMETDLKAFEIVPLYVDLTFTYLRRIPDLIVTAALPLVVGDWRSAPTHFKDWISRVDALANCDPAPNFGILRETLLNDSAWFNELRGTSPSTGKKGVRDVLEHRPVRYLVGKQQHNDEHPRFTVKLDSRLGDVDTSTDLLLRIVGCVAGLCRLMTSVHSTIGLNGEYEWTDSLILHGHDGDTIGYWPVLPSG